MNWSDFQVLCYMENNISEHNMDDYKNITLTTNVEDYKNITRTTKTVLLS